MINKDIYLRCSRIHIYFLTLSRPLELTIISLIPALNFQTPQVVPGLSEQDDILLWEFGEHKKEERARIFTSDS